jgi:pyrroloquinoline quinone biosynthesis protein B
MNYINVFTLIICVFLFSFCESKEDNENVQQVPKVSTNLPTGPYIQVLGIAQDAGFPQIACKKDCCKEAWKDASIRKQVSCLGLIQPDTKKAWLFDATPSIKTQVQELEKENELAGVFLTHAHMGHYTGLMHLGREALGANAVPVYAMPRMDTFLRTNGPWSQLVSLKNIDLQPLVSGESVRFDESLSVTPLQVPHRDEYSETVGYHIVGPRKSALFIPDIDKWHLWEQDIKEWIAKVDYALLDGSFYKNGEIPGRDMSLIPHPFMEESMTLFKDLPFEEKIKIIFIHFNHTNPVLNEKSVEYREVIEAGYRIAKEGQVLEL